ncbi:hypothetical protein H4R19_000277 [Coemansia spiralis]|nr:hypothetical protein H4R19_000277 [Coemansia spiralis]
MLLARPAGRLATRTPAAWRASLSSSAQLASTRLGCAHGRLFGSIGRPLRTAPLPAPRGQQCRNARWEQHTKADYGSKRGNSYRNESQPPKLTLSPEGIVIAIIGINGVVYLMWQSAATRAQSLSDTKMYIWMRDNFSTSWDNLTSGRVWTLLTAGFSHVGLMHLGVNMLVLHSFGPDIARMLGVRRFAVFYLAAVACGNMFSAIVNGVILPRITGNPQLSSQRSIGASTATVAVSVLFACVYPKATLLVFFVIPAPAWLVATGLIGWDLYRVLSMQESKVDGAGHLGGAAAGLGYYWFRLRPLLRRLR